MFRRIIHHIILDEWENQKVKISRRDREKIQAGKPPRVRGENMCARNGFVFRVRCFSEYYKKIPYKSNLAILHVFST